MPWCMSEIKNNHEMTVTEYATYEEAFDVMCGRVAWLTGGDADEIKNEVVNDILWNDNSTGVWTVVCRTFAWHDGLDVYDWDIKEVH